MAREAAAEAAMIQAAKQTGQQAASPAPPAKSRPRPPQPRPVQPAAVQPAATTDVAVPTAAAPAAAPQLAFPMPAMATPTMAQPAIQDMLTMLINQTKLAGQAFYLVVVPEDNYPRVEEYTTFEALLAAIKGYVKTYVCLFPFLGQRMGITDGEHRHLRTPYGLFPLFDIPKEDMLVESPHGWVGPQEDQPDTQFDEVDEEETAEIVDDSEGELSPAVNTQPEDVDQDDTPVFGGVAPS